MTLLERSELLPAGLSLRLLLQRKKSFFNAVSYSPDGNLIASISRNRTVRVWNASTGQLRWTIKVEASPLSLTWSPNGDQLAIGLVDAIVIYKVAARELFKTLPTYGLNYVTTLVWTKNQMLFAGSIRRSTFRVIDIATGEVQDLHPLVPKGILSAAVTEDGELMALGSLDRNVYVISLEKRTLIAQYRGHSAPVTALVWSRDGKVLASGSRDRTIRLWYSNGSQATVLEGATNQIRSLSFSADGRILCSVDAESYMGYRSLPSYDRKAFVRLWDLESKTLLRVVETKPPRLYPYPAAVLHPKEMILAVLTDENQVVWILDVDLEQLRKHQMIDSVPYTTAKIVLVGDTGVGKTGLGWRLANGQFKEHTSTHGQQFWTLDQLRTLRGNGTECEAVLWDLAGQPDYRLVHTLFLDDADLALILFDPNNRTEPLKGVEYWLNALQRKQSPPCRVILVGSRIDRGGLTIGTSELAAFCESHRISGGYVGTSALTGEGLEELVHKIQEQVPWDHKVATVTTAVFKGIKDCLLAIRGGTYLVTDICRQDYLPVLLPFHEIARQVEAGDDSLPFSKADLITAVGHLANHGYVTVLRTSSGDRSVLLSPDILNNLASSLILRARRDPAELGALDEELVRVNEYSFPELQTLDEEECRTLLDAAIVLFLEHNVCFRETLGSKTLLIFPALINLKKPSTEEPQIVEDVSYTVFGAVENVYAALVVLLGYTNTFTRKNQWQNQAQYELQGEVCGFIQTAEREGEIDLVLYYGATTSSHTRLLFQGLFETFLYARDVKVTKYPRVTCSSCGYPQERVEVVKRIKSGKPTIFCSECGERTALPSVNEATHLSQVDQDALEREHETAVRRTIFEQAVTHLKSVVQGLEAPSCFISYAWGVPDHERWVENRLAIDLQGVGIGVILDRWHNAAIGANVARFISLISECDYVVTVGTPMYRQKYINKLSSTGTMVASEVDLINQRLTGTEDQKATVLPALLQGDARNALPPLLIGRVYADFRSEDLYFANLFDLILTLYRIPFAAPAVRDLRESLRSFDDIAPLPRRAPRL